MVRGFVKLKKFQKSEKNSDWPPDLMDEGHDCPSEAFEQFGALLLYLDTWWSKRLQTQYICEQEVMFLVVFVCLFVVSQQEYLQSNDRICMKLLQEMCFWSRNHPLHFRNDPDYDQDPGSEWRCRTIICFKDVCLGRRFAVSQCIINCSISVLRHTDTQPEHWPCDYILGQYLAQYVVTGPVFRLTNTLFKNTWQSMLQSWCNVV